MMNLASAVTKTKSRQRLASDPSTSAWVSASAGTGKTKALNDRTLRLLLGGTPPQQILCLTFTRAAAAEMANRLNQRLVSWAIVNEEQLVHDLKDLTGVSADKPTRERARCLLARVLDAPGGMRIQTIHSFCETLLGRFPLEANITPHFSVIDEQTAAELLDATIDELLSNFQTNDDLNFTKALKVVAFHTNDIGFRALIAELTADRTRIANLLADGGLQGAARCIRSTLSLTEADTPQSILASACADDAFDSKGLSQATTLMAKGAKTDIDRAISIKAWISKSPTDRILSFSEYSRAFLTIGSAPLTRLVTKSVLSNAFPTAQILQLEQNRLKLIKDKEKKALLSEATISLLTVGDALIEAYQNAKASRNFLDYDDLILKTRDMLRQPGAAAWVLYKLDGGIDHVLIDEAQDTNPDQWQVIQSLTEEFFAGAGARAQNRTVFAVGDTKQSIYSFQRADPDAFNQMQEYFGDRVKRSCSEWNHITLDTSFRSSAAILESVDLVFSQPSANDGVSAPQMQVKHYASRTDTGGMIEIWPLIEESQKSNISPWITPITQVNVESACTILANLVAEKIKELCSGNTLLSRTRVIRPRDIMVLVRRRSAFVTDLVRALKTSHVPVSGVDRLVLTEHIAVMDLISVGRFLLMPTDDLSLAEVLKSPLCGFDDDDLFMIAHDREGSLWQALCAREGHSPEFRTAKRMLECLLHDANEKPPYELYAELLSGGGGRRAFQSRLGEEVIDPLDEFLSQALSYQSSHAPSLQEFLDRIERGPITVRRDLEQDSIDAVRILTVHGAKGLEAPIVFLPDTVQIPKQTPRLLWSADQQCLLWAARKTWLDEIGGAWSKTAEENRDREYRRLLYVAMTRAADRLYVCGWIGNRALDRRSWYNLILEGIKDSAKAEPDAFLVDRKLAVKGSVLRLRD